MAKNIGLGVMQPETACTDANCPFHGSLPVRGQVITGKVVSDRMMGTVVVERDYL
ncbi:MAG: 30S ribosomal protein S17, partial [Methanoregulaceae archaeon]|nr:30S ribosomal protein S17 [Methanoregulaceae archaeon]